MNVLNMTTSYRPPTLTDAHLYKRNRLKCRVTTFQPVHMRYKSYVYYVCWNRYGREMLPHLPWSVFKVVSKC